MKKDAAIILSVLLVLSLAPACFADSGNDSNSASGTADTFTKLDGTAWLKMSAGEKNAYLAGYIDATESAISFNKGIHYMYSESDEPSVIYYNMEYFNLTTSRESEIKPKKSFLDFLKAESEHAVYEFRKIGILKDSVGFLLKKIDNLYQNRTYLPLPLPDMVALCNSEINKVNGPKEVDAIIRMYLGKIGNKIKGKTNDTHQKKTYTD